ncbi:hypothetical protein VVT58_22605 (plasmid) [Sphingobium sp. SJ10-10]|nr:MULTISPECIES: hypothetical protein [unclassified Sphingobium]MEC6699616.1 hypothetical protein [Sphingobium sp. SJ10-10]NML91694.1 hypothetical protein [Sphingobium sp. TB-6]
MLLAAAFAARYNPDCRIAFILQSGDERTRFLNIMRHPLLRRYPMQETLQRIEGVMGSAQRILHGFAQSNVFTPTGGSAVSDALAEAISLPASNWLRHVVIWFGA